MSHLFASFFCSDIVHILEHMMQFPVMLSKVEIHTFKTTVKQGSLLSILFTFPHLIFKFGYCHVFCFHNVCFCVNISGRAHVSGVTRRLPRISSKISASSTVSRNLIIQIRPLCAFRTRCLTSKTSVRE